MLAASPRRIDTAEPGDLVYGAVISASVLATVSAHADDFSYVALAAALVLAVYWMAHVYVQAQSGVIGGDTRHILHRIGGAAARESGVLKGGVPAIVVYLVGKLAGLQTETAAEVAVYFSVALLVTVGYLAGKRAGMSGRAAVADAAVAGLFGVILIVAKSLIH